MNTNTVVIVITLLWGVGCVVEVITTTGQGRQILTSLASPYAIDSIHPLLSMRYTTSERYTIGKRKYFPDSKLLRAIALVWGV